MNSTYSITNGQTAKCSTFVDALVLCGLASSKADARKLIVGGGCYVNHERLTEDREISTDDFLFAEYIILRKGKRTYKIMQFNNVKQFFQNEH